jgi:MFS family permease
MTEPQKCLGVRLNEGITPGHLRTAYLSAFLMLVMAVGTNVLQPYMLTTFLKIPIRDHGGATGNIQLVMEIVMFLFVGIWGLACDKKGRRSVYTWGFLIMAVAYCLTPLSTSLLMLIGFRGIYTIGIAATTAVLSTVLADYVVNQDRGKANAIAGVMNGFGAMVGALAISKLPSLYNKLGQDGVTAGWSSYFSVAFICVISAVIVGFGLKGGIYHTGSKRAGLSQMAREGFQAARKDAGVALAYAAAFVSRADLVVAGLYLPLWLSRHYQAALPADAGPEQIDAACAQGIASGGALIGIIGGAGLLSAPLIGILCDRINRVSALAIGLALNVIGYGLIFFVEDPTGGMIKLAAVFIGFGKVGGTITAQVLIQQHAEPAYRGTIIGFFNVWGALGIMLSCWLGGIVFDAIRPNTTFEIVAVFNLIVVIMALVLKKRIKVPVFAEDDGDPAPAH